jgi:uncharacterized metal-binding protein YceD (DUF177 family)
MAGAGGVKPDVPWTEPLRLSELGHGQLTRRLVADEGARERVAALLGLDGLPELTAEVAAAPWLDGVRLTGAWSATVRQTCGVTLDPFETELSGEFDVRAVPESSPAAAPPEREAALDLESEDPPDVLAEDRVDLAMYVVEHLALEIDPYPRKPGVEFEPPPPEPEASPFDVLKTLKPRDAG